MDPDTNKKNPEDPSQANEQAGSRKRKSKNDGNRWNKGGAYGGADEGHGDVHQEEQEVILRHGSDSWSSRAEWIVSENRSKMCFRYYCLVVNYSLIYSFF